MGLRRLLGLKKNPIPELVIPEAPPPEPVIEESEEEVLTIDPMVPTSAYDPTGLFGYSPKAVEPLTGVLPGMGPIPFRSETCSSHHFLLSCYQHWCQEIDEVPRYHRKQWEFVYILQSLWERGYLTAGKRGVGFGVGREPLSAVMASHGCNVVATDLEVEAQMSADWANTVQHASTLAHLNDKGICAPSVFEKNVTFRPVNMNHIPSDLQGFDFSWSACCLEHLGSLQAGMDFYKNSLACLKPGGLAIHTTEINLSSLEDTVEVGDTVLYRQQDIERLMDELRSEGHACEPLLIHYGSQPIDGFVDVPPYRVEPHLRLTLEQYVTTSIGVITRKAM
ncbi:Methyltransferase type 11 [Sulfitobacter noctilucae]|uniref:class I SAM-dependent methyltransferase n=1 Tax=Sulfitobacter noctilucae TaxID=1342302 RepID=UPI000469EF5E|nr:class I SAM-dependent methyltransferase [Sulfitobacter noctilucae]KIN61582.1 Methyltransferase type 11 [Sulfitobacter noctilucae]